MASDSRYLGSARIIAFCTLISRITGLARDMILNHVYGQGWVQDAFNYGFQIPNLFRRLFGEGALSAVFLPVFTDVLDKRGRPAAWVLLGRVTGLVSLSLVAVTIAIELVVLAIHQFAPGGAMRGLQLGLTALMLPFMISICLLALFSSILNCLNHFTVPALMPIVLNVMNMIGALFVGPAFGKPLETQVFGVAASVLAASVLQLCLILPVLRGHGVQFRVSLDLADPDLRHILRMFLPVVLGQGVLLLNVFFDSQICTSLTCGPSDAAAFSLFGHTFEYPLRQGALSAVTNAQRLYQFPLGVLAISLATAAFPLFSLYASRRDFAGLRSTLSQSMRVAVFEGLPCGLVMIVLAEPIVSLLFEHGRFGPEATLRAARVLRWYGVGMPAYCCQHILLRGFYSLKDTLTPMWISCSLVLLNILLSLTFVWHPALRESAFGISTSVTSCLHVAISMVLLRRRMKGRIDGRAIVGSFLRTALCSVAAAAVAWMLLEGTGRLDLSGMARTAQRAICVFAPLGSAILVYLIAAWFFNREEVRLLLHRERPAREIPDGVDEI